MTHKTDFRILAPLKSEFLSIINYQFTTKLVFLDPARYGFHLADEDHYSPIETESVRVVCPEDVPIRVVAQAARTDFKTIKDLNPEIRGHYLARGGHEITVPRGGSEGFGPKFEGLLKKYLAAQSERVYIVKPGDSLSAIADRFGVPLTSLLVGNRLDVTRPIHPGQEIIVFQHDVPSVGSDLDQAEQ